MIRSDRWVRILLLSLAVGQMVGCGLLTSEDKPRLFVHLAETLLDNEALELAGMDPAQTAVLITLVGNTAKVVVADAAEFQQAQQAVSQLRGACRNEVLQGMPSASFGQAGTVSCLATLASLAVASLQEQEIPVGGFPVDAVFADFNGDGLVDIAIANQDSSEVSILLALSGDSFGQATNFPVGSRPSAIRAGDFNGDGKVDLVTANLGIFVPAGVSLLTSNGDGSFQPAVELNPEAGTIIANTAVAVADFNSDGNEDIVVARLNADQGVRVLLGNGDGSFQTPRDFDASAYSLAVADFNGDGSMDIAAGNNPLSILMGDGTGDFQLYQAFGFAFNGTVFQVQAADLDRDGDPDLVTTNFDNSVAVLLNQGDGSFQDPHFYAANDRPENLSVLDLDGDGLLDLLVSNTNADHASTLFGNGDGSFVGVRGFSAAENSSSSANSLAAADFTGNGRVDVAVASGRNTFILPSLADGTLGARMGLGKRGDYLAAADFNQDGHSDLALVRRTNDDGFVQPGVVILLGSGNGAFTDGATLPIAGFEFQSGPIFAGRINGDDFFDLLLIDKVAGQVKFYAGNGDGGFQAAIDTPVGTGPVWIALGDLNEDGTVDLVIGLAGDPGQLNGGVFVLPGNGDGTFQAPVEIVGQAQGGRVALGDLDGDGHLDLAAAIEKPQFTFNLSVLPGNGNGTFQAATNLAPADEFSFLGVGGLAIDDFDQDGAADVLVASSGNQTLIGYPGNGDGSFQAPVSGDIGPDPRDMVVADLNLDQKPDVALASGALVMTLVRTDVLFADGFE